MPDLDRILDDVYAEFPRLRRYRFNLKYGRPNNIGPITDDFRRVEFLGPNEPSNPSPGRPTIEVFDRSLNSDQLRNAVKDDALHHVARIDKTFRKMKMLFRVSMTPQQEAMNQRAYQKGVDDGETRSYEKWMDRSRIDQFIGGYLAPVGDEWQRPGTYTPDQVKILEAMKTYLSSEKIPLRRPAEQERFDKLDRESRKGGPFGTGLHPKTYPEWWKAGGAAGMMGQRPWWEGTPEDVAFGFVGGGAGRIVHTGGPNKWLPRTSGPAKGQVRPSLDHLRQGEGSMVRGWGSYSAEARYVGQNYGKINRYDIPDKDIARYLDLDKPLSKQPQTIQDAVNTVLPFKNPTWRSKAEYLHGSETHKVYTVDDQIIAVVDKVEGTYYVRLGNRFRERGQRKNFQLFWDEVTTGKAFSTEAAATKYAEAAYKNAPFTGIDAYRQLSRRLGSDEAASKALREAGIPGSKFFDSFSRPKQRGTRNYVTWDQRVLDRAKMLNPNPTLLDRLEETFLLRRR